MAQDLTNFENEFHNEFEEVDETRKPCTLILFGDVNSGKSTICGSIMY